MAVRPLSRQPIAALLAALLLAACGTDGQGPTSAAPSAQGGGSSVTVPLPVTIPMPRAPAPTASAPTIAAPEALVGQSAEAVNALLGEPAFTRRDGPTAIWQYRGEGCVLDLFLFQAEPAHTPVVDHAELRSLPAGGARPDPACLQALLTARQTS